MDYETFYHQAFLSMWIVLDSCIMLTYQAFLYILQLLSVKNEIVKNFYTLKFLSSKRRWEARKKK